jgi:anti-anti-sigma regulatory factor
MAMTIELKLPAELSIYTVSEEHARWRGLLDSAEAGTARTVVVSAGAVDEVDGAGVQMLQSLVNEVVRRERVLKLVGVSAPLAAACATLGLGALARAADAKESA